MSDLAPLKRVSMLHQTIKEYERLAPHYDERWSAYVHCSTRETLDRLPLDPAKHQRLLDVGCGTGVLLKAVQERFPRVEVVGVDPSPAMLSVARRRLPERAALLESRAENLPVSNGQFDLVVSCNAFHFFEYPHRAVGEMKRVLKPTGRLVVTDWCDDFICCKLCGLFLRAMRRPFHKIYNARECVRLVRDAGFQIMAADHYKIGLLWGLMTLRAAK